MQDSATNILGPLIESVGTLTLVLLTYHRFTVEAEGAVHVLRGEERGNLINLGFFGGHFYCTVSQSA